MLEQVMIKSILLIFVIRENKFFLSVNCHPLFFWFVNCARGPPLPFVRPSYKKDTCLSPYIANKPKESKIDNND